MSPAPTKRFQFADVKFTVLRSLNEIFSIMRDCYLSTISCGLDFLSTMWIWNMVLLECIFSGRCSMKTREELNILDFEDARYRSEFRSAAREHLRDYVEAVTEPVPRFGSNSFICPCCKSGTGNNGKYTPAFTLFRTQAGELHFKCHACDITGDIFTLAGLVNQISDFGTAEKIVASFLGVDLSHRTPLSKIKVADAKTKVPPSQTETVRLKKEAYAYIKQCRKNIGKTDYFHHRGLNDETIQRFGLGYDPKDKMAVIPFSPTYYMSRNTQVGVDEKGMRKHYKPSGLRQPLFNLASLTDTRDPVFLVEAPMDAMSIVQSGGNALALGGTSTSTLKTILKVYQPNNVFILAFDNDSVGMRLRDKLTLLFEEQGIPYLIPVHDVFSSFKDPNAALMSAPEALAEGVAAEKNRAIGLANEANLGETMVVAAKKAVARLSHKETEIER